MEQNRAVKLLLGKLSSGRVVTSLLVRSFPI